MIDVASVEASVPNTTAPFVRCACRAPHGASTCPCVLPPHRHQIPPYTTPCTASRMVPNTCWCTGIREYTVCLVKKQLGVRGSREHVTRRHAHHVTRPV
jgi:hypothetical protein